jgi:hypothetical protein
MFSKSAYMHFIRVRSAGLFKQACLLFTLLCSVSYRFNIGLYSFAGQGDLMLCFSCYPFPSKLLRFLQFRHHRISFSLHYIPFNIFQAVDYYLLYVFSIYKTRKKALGPFKKEIMGLPQQTLDVIAAEIENEFDFLFKQLNVVNKRASVNKYCTPTGNLSL